MSDALRKMLRVGDVAPRLNYDLIDRVVSQVTTSPESWDQTTWRSDSGRRCIAGWTVELSGATWVDAAADHGEAYVVTDEAVDGPALAALVEAAELPGTPVHDRAQRLLGLTDAQAETLFDSRLDAGWLHVVVERLHAVDRPVPRPWVVRSYRWGPHELYLTGALTGDVEADRRSRQLYLPLTDAGRWASEQTARTCARRYLGSERHDVQRASEEEEASARAGHQDDPRTPAVA